MVGMSGDALWFENDERGDVAPEPAVDASVELSVGHRVETPGGEAEQREPAGATRRAFDQWGDISTTVRGLRVAQGAFDVWSSKRPRSALMRSAMSPL